MKSFPAALAFGVVCVFQTSAAVPAIDLSDGAARKAMPAFKRISSAGGVADGIWANGRWAYRFHITKPWNGELPQWPSIDIPVAVTNWVGYDRLVLDVYNDNIGGDALGCFISEPTGRIQNGLNPKALPLKDYGFHRWVISLKKFPDTCNPANIKRLHLFFTAPTAADVYVSGFHLLKPNEPLPPVDATFQKEKIEAGLARAEALRKARRQESMDRFLSRCRAAGQTGDPCWFGMATSMEKIRPRANDFDVKAAQSFSLKLARGERESLQVLVMPNGRDLKDVTVEISPLQRERNGFSNWFGTSDVMPSSVFKVSPMGYVQTVNPPPYKGPVNVATNLPGGYLRETQTVEQGWWPDPILDYLDKADVKGDDLQSFWVRCTCPDDQRAGIYRGTLRVTGEGWRKDFPLTVRVYDFSVPKKSPLPLAITFGPGPNSQFADEEQLALIKKLKADPQSPANCWKAHETTWGDFLADYYITMDSLYHAGKGVHWEVLKRLKEQGRLGLFNLAYWGCVQDTSEKGKAAWIGAMHARLDESYAKAKELGLLDHAYMYGCDEVSTNYFENIKWSVAELKKLYPGVPIFTTAYDHDFGVGSALADMDWFTPTTERYAENVAKIPASRASGHKVWWYIACGPHAPFANMFVEYQAIEARQLMGAQTVKFRPDGFLYYQVSIWNALRPISGPNTFTDWNPRSWTKYHGDGSWFCCGPDGLPCATIRMENFRDGLEDYAYALEYERVTGKHCDVPPEVCRSITQFTDNPDAYYAWRDAIADGIEAAAGVLAACVDDPLTKVRAVDLDGGYFTTVERHPAAEIASNWRSHPAAGLTEVAWVEKPTPDSFIRCILFLPPADRWDGRLHALGSGGPAGYICKDGLARTANDSGSAVVYTDLGSSDREMTRPGRTDDFGHRATHLMTARAKKIIEAFYGRPAHHCYFEGSSTGGNQAFQELLRYPDDYDGIIAGVPAFARAATHVYFQWNWRQLHDDNGKEIFSHAELVAVTNAAERYFAETGKTGVARRYTEENERAVLARAVALAPTLGTDDKRERLHRMFTGPVVRGRHVGKGVAFGAWLPHTGSNEWMLRWQIGKDRPLQSVTDDDLEKFIRDWGPACDATSTDMSAFAGHGGKLIAYAGEIDPCIPWEPLVDWHQAANCPESRAVFLLPEREHGGPTRIKNAYWLLVNWVEKDARPDIAPLVRANGCVLPLESL